MYDDGTKLQESAGLVFDATNKALTLGGATVTTSNPVLNLSQTWDNGTTTFTGLKFNVTDTGSASGSLLLDLQVGGTTQFRVDKSGRAQLATDLWMKSDATNRGLFFGSSADLVLTRAAAATLQLGVGDAAAPVAQTLQVQSITGTNASAAAYPFKIIGAAGTGDECDGTERRRTRSRCY